jgi:hypothetical protein
LKIVPWIVHIASPILFLVAGYLFARRRPDRNGLLFATTFAVVYAIVDGAMMGYPGILSAEFLWSMLANLAAGMIGAVVGGRKASRSA